MIITPTSLSISQLFGSINEQYVIPAYQRRYSWHERQVWELIEDVLLIEEGDTHLLGSIVCLASHHKAGLNELEVVDGQQRLTTITILLECIRQRLVVLDEADEAADLGRLLIARALEGATLRKVALDSIDLAEFERLVKGDFEQRFQNLQLRAAFGIVREWVGSQTLKKLKVFLYRLKTQAVVIRLDVSDAKEAFKLFEMINNRGLRLSPTDIIKNFLLGNAARFSAEDLKMARSTWASLIVHLDGTNADAFFRYYLMALLKARVRAGEVVASFKRVFMSQVLEAGELPDRHLYADVDETDDDSVEDQTDGSLVSVPSIPSDKVPFEHFLARLCQSAKVYGELTLAKFKDDRINRHLRNLRMIKAVQTYGFLMHLRLGGCDDKQFREILLLTEAFVLRRHVCKERSNETESLFARLCAVDPLTAIAATREAYRGLCPADEKFRDELANTTFTATLIDRARYCLERIEASMHGKHNELQVLGAEEVHVEHIIPQKIRSRKAKDEFGDWVNYLGKGAEAAHPQFVTRLGNLTLFAGPLNISASNDPFEKKRQAYRNSGLLMTQRIADLDIFDFHAVDWRSQELADIAIELWPLP